MSTETSVPKSTTGASASDLMLRNHFLPLVLLGCGFLVFLGWQVTRITRERTALQDSLTQREPAIVQAVETQKRLEKLVMDLLDVAKTNSEARRIVSQYNIQYNPGKKTAPAPGDETGN